MREKLQRVMDKFVEEIEKSTAGQASLVDLEERLLESQGPLMQEMLQVLKTERASQGDFPPSQ